MRRKPKPDTRPRWNDPNLKIYYGKREYTADEWQIMCAAYKNDPTYNLKRNKNEG